MRSSQRPSHIKSSTFNYSFNLETSKHDSRSSFIASSDRNVSWRSNQRNLLYSFIVKIHTEDCTRIYTNTNWLFVTLFRERAIYLLRKLCVQHLIILQIYCLIELSRILVTYWVVNSTPFSPSSFRLWRIARFGSFDIVL